MNRVCDAGAFCLQRPQCEYRCHFTNAGLEGEARFENTVITQPELTRKIKPWPVIPDDIEPVPQSWQVIGSVLVGAALVVLMVICLGLFFTGLWVWSLLI
jgi:hypothetical protein